MDRPVCVITGAAGDGLARGLCRSVAAAGFTVVVTDIDGEAAERRAQELRDSGSLETTALSLDVTDPRAIHVSMARVIDRWGRIDGLVNSAGIGLVKPAADVSLEEWAAVLDTDLRGAWLCACAVIPFMAHRGSGSIVNIGSVQALGPHVGYAIYAAAKAGLVGLTRGIAADYGRSGIRCNIVHPGLVDSEQGRRLISAWAEPTQWISRYVATKQMLPLLIEPDDVGTVVAFLLGPQARAITGSELVVDAGSSVMAFDREVPES